MLPSSETLQFPTRRTHRTYNAQFKAEMVAACSKPGASISALALAQGMNPNVLHRWLREHERNGLHCLTDTAGLSSTPAVCPSIGGFVPLQLPVPAVAAKSKSCDIEVELRKGELQLHVRWPANMSAEFANWTAALLR
jgi:lambda repressor-like predicted transcriptional regulator